MRKTYSYEAEEVPGAKSLRVGDEKSDGEGILLVASLKIRVSRG